ncbi:FecR domain-containing protein [Pseudomonas sp. K1(2024)]|uniref:FecR domain-containing protein n=1 Tax=Pseudomonas boreofloridensis TaxID=3064348 RepID=A0ABV4Z698_9PSED
MSPMPAARFDPDPHQEALQWLALLSRPGSHAQQRKAFAQWCQDPENARAFAALQHRPGSVPTLAGRPRPRPLALRRSHWGSLLGALFLLLLAALAFVYWPLMQRLGSELHTSAGERRSVRLADGSTLHLDGASAMNVDLRGRTRQLQLVQGLMDLEVNLDGRALEVQVDDVSIQVFATRLRLSRYGDHDELVVLNGKALIRQGGDQRLLSAGERVRFDSGHLEAVEKVDTRSLQAWRDGRLIARDLPLQQVLEALAGYRGMRVWVLDAQIGQRRISGDFALDPASNTLDALIADQQLRAYPLLGQALIVH